MRRRCCRVSLKHGGLPNPICIGHRTSKSGYIIKVQLSHHSELVTNCSCMNQQPTPPRLTSSQDHRVGHITLCLCENRAGVRLVVNIQKASIKLALKRLYQFPAKVAGQSIPLWLKPILCPQWGHCISTGLNGDSRMA